MMKMQWASTTRSGAQALCIVSESFAPTRAKLQAFPGIDT